MPRRYKITLYPIILCGVLWYKMSKSMYQLAHQHIQPKYASIPKFIQFNGIWLCLWSMCPSSRDTLCHRKWFNWFHFVHLAFALVHPKNNNLLFYYAHNYENTQCETWLNLCHGSWTTHGTWKRCTIYAN